MAEGKSWRKEDWEGEKVCAELLRPVVWLSLVSTASQPTTKRSCDSK
jgi:hypothetical protein